MPRKPKRDRAVSSAPPGESTLAVSPKKQQWENLSSEHQWLLKQIKRKQTESGNFIEQMRSLALEIWEKGQPFYQEVDAIDTEIHNLFAEILAMKKGKKTQQKITSIYRMLQFTGTISIQSDGEDEDNELDELFEAEAPDRTFGEEFGADNYDERVNEQQSSNSNQPATPKQLRKTFLRLAEVFHPDRAIDSETHTKHTEIMKELNRAYSDGDVARLLEIEKSIAEGKSVPPSNSDDFELNCQKLKAENELLKEQYELLKKELRLARNTPEGMMVKEYRKAVRAGVKDPLDQWFGSAEAEIEGLKELRNFVRDFRDRKITLQEFLRGPSKGAVADEEILEAMLAQMLFGSI